MTRAWRNQDHIRKWFFHSDPITTEQHLAWWQRYQDRDDDFVFIIEETETLNGFIIQNRDEIPKQKETYITGNYQFDILNVSDTRIETVKLKVLK